MNPRLAVAALLAVALAAPTLARAQGAQNFPTKPVKFNVPYAAGTGPEVFARLLAEKLTKAWGKQVVVEAKPGASGFIAIEAMKNAPADGHELIVAANGHTSINPALYKKLPYDPERDLVPAAMVYRTPFFVAVSATGPYQTVPALIAAAKANPDKLTYGSPYIGSPAHLGTAELEMLTGTRMIHVPFKDQNQAFISIANGELTWMLSTLASAQPMMKAGRIKLLAVATKERYKALPDLPTVGEAGGPAALEVEAWIALFAPRGTPNDVIRKINADVNREISQPDLVERMSGAGWVASPMSPEDLAALIRRETRKFADLVKRTGASAD